MTGRDPSSFSPTGVSLHLFYPVSDSDSDLSKDVPPVVLFMTDDSFLQERSLRLSSFSVITFGYPGPLPVTSKVTPDLVDVSVESRVSRNLKFITGRVTGTEIIRSNNPPR